jgi:hypothetical protein
VGGPSVLGPAGAAGAWFAFAVWRVAALAATALSAAGGSLSRGLKAIFCGAKTGSALDSEWRHAKLRRMQRQLGRRPVR